MISAWFLFQKDFWTELSSSLGRARRAKVEAGRHSGGGGIKSEHPAGAMSSTVYDSEATQVKTDKQHIQIKNFCASKGVINRVKRQPME